MTVSELLAGNASFTSLSTSDREAVAGAMVPRDYPDNHVFFREGDRGHDVFFVVEGEVQVTGKGAPEELNRLGPGALFGLLAIVDDEPRSATCRALGPVVVASLSRAAVSLLFNQAAPIACAFQRALGAQLAQDFRQLDRRLHELAR